MSRFSPAASHKTLLESMRPVSPAGRAWLRLLSGTVLGAVFFFLLALVQFATPDLAGTDDYFHIKFAQLMRMGGLKPAFPWLPLTILNPAEFYDHHFLFHVGLIPFTLGDLVQSAKWASVLFASAAFLSVWGLLHSQQVRYAGLWALGLLAISSAFLYRMSMVRPPALALAIMVIALALLFSRRYFWLLPLSFLFVWLYDAFPLILIISGIHVISVGLIEHRLEWRPVVYAGAGIGLGLLINPYFPDNIVFTFRHILPKLTAATAIRVGNEWYPYRTTTLLENSPLALVALLGGALALGLQERRMDARTLTSFLLAAFFGLLLFQSRRFVEYFPPFALIFAALAWAPLLARTPRPPVPEQTSGGESGSARRLGAIWRARAGWLPAACLALLVAGGMAYTLPAAQDAMRAAAPAGQYAHAAAWLEEHTSPGERIFQTDWDDFPRLFFHNTRNTYLVGLDPTYLQLADAGLYDQWVDITRGRIAKPAGAISGPFGARYVLSDLRHASFIDQAGADPAMREVYRDDEAVIYRIGELEGK